MGHKNMVFQGRGILVTGSITLKCGTCQEYAFFQDRWSPETGFTVYDSYCLEMSGVARKVLFLSGNIWPLLLYMYIFPDWERSVQETFGFGYWEFLTFSEILPTPHTWTCILKFKVRSFIWINGKGIQMKHY